MNKILVLGASSNPDRFSYKVVVSLLRRKFDVIPLGYREGKIHDLPIMIGKPTLEGIYTILLYLGKEKQKDYYQYILNLHPKRLIFNPGTENYELAVLAEQNGIEIIEDCALIMISEGELL